uniref:Uncharacterized protein n=1 Tax=Kalanchoe fedtschenkoi TaxID=63787 RepID=A0A7N0UB38_KALFE
MSSALDTLCGQAYGAKQHPLVGIHMQRSILVHLMTCILKAAGQNVRGNSPSCRGLRFVSHTECFWLRNTSKPGQVPPDSEPRVPDDGLTILLHAFLCWAMILKSKLGFRGAALTTSISVWLSVLVYSLYVKFSPLCKETWPGFSKEALSGLGVLDIRAHGFSSRSPSQPEARHISAHHHVMEYTQDKEVVAAVATMI